MNNRIARLGFSLVAILASCPAWAASLQTMDVASLPGDKIELKLTFDEPVAAPKGYTIEQPARIALDLPGVNSQLGTKNRELGVGNARSVTVVEAGDRTRLIINLTTLQPYSTRAEGNQLFVIVGDSVGSVASSVSPNPAAPASKSYAATTREIKNIDFQRGADGEGNIVIDLSDSSVSPDIREQGEKILISFAKTSLPEQLRVRLDVKDFATPVQFVNASRKADSTEILVEAAGKYDHMA